MRASWLLMVICFLSCGEEPEEISVFTPKKNKAAKPIVVDVDADTITSFTEDTFEKKEPAPVAPNAPSGIYQFLYPLDEQTTILHTVSFSKNRFSLQEEFLNKKDSVLVAEGTWSPSQGYIWLYKDQLVRGRYVWKGDTLQYFSPAQNKKYSMNQMTSAAQNPVWLKHKNAGAILYGVGTEPFWSIEIFKNDSLVLSMPHWSEPLTTFVSEKTNDAKGRVYKAAPDSLQITVQPLFCSDGMSDFVYTNKLRIRFKNQVYNGCGVSF